MTGMQQVITPAHKNFLLHLLFIINYRVSEIRIGGAMHFHLHTLIRWELDVVIARLFMRRDRADKGDDPFISTFHPEINITRSPGINMQNLRKSKKI